MPIRVLTISEVRLRATVTPKPCSSFWRYSQTPAQFQA